MNIFVDYLYYLLNKNNLNLYIATNIKSGENVAVKLEPVKTKFPQLYYEAKLYKYLKGTEGIPNVYYYGTEGDYNWMVIDMLGPSLEDLFDYWKRKFSLSKLY